MYFKNDVLILSVLLFLTGIGLAVSADRGRPFALRDWQTLIASLVALDAASLAYKGAMAKVDLDRSLALRAERRKRVTAAMQLRYAARVMGHRAQWILRHIPADKVAVGDSMEWSVLRIEAPKEINDIWPSAEILPRSAANLLYRLRISDHGITAMTQILTRTGANPVIVTESNLHIVQIILSHIKDVVTDCEQIEAVCNVAIRDQYVED